jgi:hypothetical protein
MRNNKANWTAILLLVFVLSGLQAQEAIPASGGDHSSSGGSVSYSLGQVFYTTLSTSGGSVSQGVQQPYEIMVVTSIEEAKNITLSVSAYPIPANDYLQLKIDNYDSETLFYQLFDLNGKLLIHKKVEAYHTSIPIDGLDPGTYFLRISDNKKEIKSFKMTKN